MPKVLSVQLCADRVINMFGEGRTILHVSWCEMAKESPVLCNWGSKGVFPLLSSQGATAHG